MHVRQAGPEDLAGLIRLRATWRSQAAALRRLVLSPSEASVPLYERLGFREARELRVTPWTVEQHPRPRTFGSGPGRTGSRYFLYL